MTIEKTEEKEVLDAKAEDKKEEDGEGQSEPVLTEIEQSAVTYGWQPKDAWVKDGKEAEEWVPAKHFMKFGELKQQVISKDKQLNKTEKLIRMMKDHHLKVREDAYTEARKVLMAEKRKALEENDLVLVERIKDQLEEEKERFAKQKPLPREIEEAEREYVNTPVQSGPPPEFFDFQSRNPWYKLQNQDEMSVDADKIGVAEFQYEINSAKASGRQPDLNKVYKTVETKIRKLYPEKFSTPRSPQQESGSKVGSGGKSVKLTDDELAVAKAFGLSPEKYQTESKTYKGR